MIRNRIVCFLTKAPMEAFCNTIVLLEAAPLFQNPEKVSGSEIKRYHKNIVDNSRTTDSGMDEGSNSSTPDAGESDDEEVISRKPSKSMHRILDDDSDLSQDVPDSSSKPKKTEYATPEEALDAVMNDSDDDKDDNNSDESDSESRQPTTPASAKKKVVRPVDSDSSDDEEENLTLAEALHNKKEDAVPNQEPESVQSQKKDKPEEYATPEEALEAVMNDSSDDEQDREKSTQMGKGDLFDDEHSSGDSGRSDSRLKKNVKSSGSEDERSGGEQDDEGFDESSIDPKLLAKLKKGAAKKAPREKRKSRKEELVGIHSETQRMVRESRVSIPYHQPAPKSINDFLARAKSKQEQYKVLRGVRDRKVKIVEDILAKTRIKSKPKSQEEMDKYSDSDEDWNPDDDKEKTLKERLDEKFGKTSEQTDKSNSEDAVVDEKKSGHTGNDDCDSLPDLCESQDTKLDSLSQCANTESTVVDTLTNAVTVASAEQMDVSESQSGNVETSESSSVVPVQDKSVTEIDAEIEGITTFNNSDKVSNSEKVTDNETIEATEVSSQVVKETDSNSEAASDVNAEKYSSQTLKDETKTGKGKLAALAGIDLDAVKPCLSGHLDSFISFEEEEAPKNPGVLKLMDRFCKHSAKREKKNKKDKDISVISKDKTGIDSEELKLNTFTYHVEDEEKNPLMKLETPGAKLVALKQQLAGRIKEKREHARQVRQEAYDLDNEAGALDIEEEEAEMSDRSDTDDEEEGAIGEEEDYDEEAEDGMDADVEEEEKERNPFADDEADEEEGDDDDDDDDGIDDRGDDGDDEDDDEDGMNLKLDVSDEEEENEPAESDDEVMEVKKGKNTYGKSTTAFLSADDKAKEPEFKEPFVKKIPEKPFSMFGGSSITSVSDSQFQSAQKSSGLVLPVEDSQDLYGNNNSSTIPDLLSTQARATQAAGAQSQSQEFSFFLEDSQSNMLDADGFLKTKSSVKKPAAPSALDDLAGTQDNMADLLGLCSGKFAGTQNTSSKEKISRKSLFDESSASTQGPMDDLVGLCSGVFPDDRATQAEKKGTKRKVSQDSEDDDDDAIEALSDNEEHQSEKDEFSDNEEDGDREENEEEAGDTDQLDSDDEEEKPQRFTGFLAKNKRGKILKDFVDEEAELSGSEFDSDENLDLAEEDDIMEVEEGDKLMKNVDQDELRDEIGRVHMKQIIDEDKRELLRFQEMYLPDGDLHSEGGGRTRRFKWSNMDDDTQQDMFADGSDGEVEHEEHENDFEWRKERYEREQFLKQQQEEKENNNENNNGENSQFLKFGKVFLKKQCSVDNSATNKEKSTKPAAAKEADNTDGIGSFYKLSKQKRGSFLARSKESLAKIAEKTKPISNPSAGAKTSGKFTFNVISPEKGKENEASPAGKQRKAHVPKLRAPAAKKPPAKKPKLDDPQSFTENSIFNHL